MALCYAEEFGLQNEVQMEMSSGLTPEQALCEWDCFPSLKKIDFGIDTDPFMCSKKYDFQKELVEILGREMPWNSCFFGCAEWLAIDVTEKQHEKIAKLLILYYENNYARGIMCSGLKKFMQQ